MWNNLIFFKDTRSISPNINNQNKNGNNKQKRFFEGVLSFLYGYHIEGDRGEGARFGAYNHTNPTKKFPWKLSTIDLANSKKTTKQTYLYKHPHFIMWIWSVVHRFHISLILIGVGLFSLYTPTVLINCFTLLQRVKRDT